MDDGGVDCALGACPADWPAPDDCAASGDGAVPVEEVLAAVGDVVVELPAGAAACAGATFCAAGDVAGGAAFCPVSVCGAGVCAGGAAAEPDCGAGVELDCAGGGAGGGGGGFGCFTSDGGGSSCVSGGVLFCGGEDCAEHGRSVAKAAQNIAAHRSRVRHNIARFSSTNLRGTSPREGKLTATVLIRPFPPDASVRNPRVPLVTTESLLQGSLLVRFARVNRRRAGHARRFARR